MAKFTEEEDKIIRELYSRAPWEEILLKLPGRGKRAILERAGRIGVSRDLSHIHHNYRTRSDDWSENEDLVLEKFYSPETKAELLMNLPGRTWAGIKSRANNKGLVYIEREDITGQIFGYWKILEVSGLKVRCLCIGCNEKEKLLDRFDVVHSRSRSCGCQRSALSENSSLKKFGVKCYTQTSEYQVRRRETTLRKYGVEHNFQIEGVRKANLAKTQKTKLDKGLIKKFTDGPTLAELCSQVGANYSHALSLYKTNKQAAFDYLKNYKGPKVFGTTEMLFISIMKDVFPNLDKYNVSPKEFKIRNKPDFRIEHNNKVLYINIDGLFWHSVVRRKKKDYHLQLQKDFTNNKQTIFQFREDELRDKGTIVKSIVQNYFGLSSAKYAARKLKIKKNSYSESREFFENNHLMGSSKAISYGLYDGDDLVCCIGIKVKNGVLDVVRFATKNFCSVAGGLSKLLSHVIKIYKPRIVLSWCDMRYSTGQSYQKLGFKLEKTSLSWRWTDFEKTFNRLKCRANMDDRNLTQVQHAKELGWHQIYDAGQAKYILTVQDNI
jgi:hypothetical protein